MRLFKAISYISSVLSIVFFASIPLSAQNGGAAVNSEGAGTSITESAPDSLVRRVDSLMAQYDTAGTPGAVIGVIRDGEPIFARGYGMANLTHGIPITPLTRFNIASISKQFTGFAFALLEQKGKLSLDDPARKYLPGLPEFDETVTLRHLLTHTSGYREAYGTMALRGRLASRDYLSREESIEVVRRQPALEFSPGSHRRYNSTAYVILALILEEVTGEPFPKWMKKRVFDPLGMNQTVIESKVGEVIPGSAVPYYKGKQNYTTAYSNRAIYGSAEIYTTVADLAKWMQNFHDAELGGKAVQERLRERYVLTNGDTTRYGLGIGIDRERGLARVHHSGSHAGYGSKLNYYPELNAGVIVMGNHGDLNAGRTAGQVARIFFGEHMKLQKEPKPETERESLVDSARLADYSGRFQAENGEILFFEKQGSRLILKRYPEVRHPLKATSDTTFQSPDTKIQVTFHPGNGENVDQATLQESAETRLHRIGPWSPGFEELKTFEGRYLSPELETIYTVTVKDSQLVAEHRINGKIKLTPVKNTLKEGTFETEKGSIQPTIRFERNEVGLVTGFYASLWRTENVWFYKQ